MKKLIFFTFFLISFCTDIEVCINNQCKTIQNMHKKLKCKTFKCPIGFVECKYGYCTIDSNTCDSVIKIILAQNDSLNAEIKKSNSGFSSKLQLCSAYVYCSNINLKNCSRYKHRFSCSNDVCASTKQACDDLKGQNFSQNYQICEMSSRIFT